MKRALTVIAVAACCFASGLASGDVTAAPGWDQAQVTRLARELAAAVEGLEAAFRREPSAVLPTGNERSRYAAQQDIKRLRSETRKLASALGEGRGLDETRETFANVRRYAHRAEENGKLALLTQPTLDYIARAMALLEQLAPRYGERWQPLRKAPGSDEPGSGSGR